MIVRISRFPRVIERCWWVGQRRNFVVPLKIGPSGEYLAIEFNTRMSSSQMQPLTIPVDVYLRCENPEMNAPQQYSN